MNLLKHFLLTGIIFISLFTLVSCDKTKNFEDLDVLTGKQWRLHTITLNGVQITDSCDLDDVLSFQDETSFDYDYGTQNCDNSEENEDPVRWKIIDDFTVLKMKHKFNNDGVKGSAILYWRITELTDSTLILEDAYAEDNNLDTEIRTYRL